MVDTRDPDTKVTKRRHWCGMKACGARWNSIARIEKEDVYSVVPRAQDVVPRPPPTVTLRYAQQTRVNGTTDRAGETQQTAPVLHKGNGHSALSVVFKGEGGSLSDPVLSDPDPSGSLSLPIRSQGVDRAVVRRKKGEPFAFKPDFLAFWFAIKSNRAKGSKAEAFERWTEEKPPSSAVLIGKWGEYMTSLGETFAVDVCRWLAKRRWEEEYGPAPVGKSAATDTRCNWHRDPRHDSTPSAFPKSGCPRCKHFAAFNRGRQGDAEHAAGALPRWSTEPSPAEWTPEQKAEAAALTAQRKANGTP